MSHGTALITGATSGIGTAFAEALPASTNLLLTGRDGERLDGLKQQLDRPRRWVRTLSADLSDEAGCRAVTDWAAKFGADLLINNAGLGRFGRLHENPADAERAMVMVNVMAPVLITNALLPEMLSRARSEKRRAGVIVVASTAAFQPVPGLTTYAATKAFDLSFAEGLWEEMRGEPVDVLALCPGATRTAFFERAGGEGRAMPRMASPDIVARSALSALGRSRVCFPGVTNRVTSWLGHYLPRGVVLRGGANVTQRVIAASASRRGR